MSTSLRESELVPRKRETETEDAHSAVEHRCIVNLVDNSYVLILGCQPCDGDCLLSDTTVAYGLPKEDVTDISVGDHLLERRAGVVDRL